MNEDEWKKWKEWYKQSIREWKQRYRKALQEWKERFADWKVNVESNRSKRIHPPLPPIPPIPPMHSVSIGRVNVVASRIGDEELRLIDMLIEAGVFNTRSEAVAYLVIEGIKARQDVFDKVSSGLREIRNIRKKAEEHVEKLKEEIGFVEPEDIGEIEEPEKTCSACGKDLSDLPENIAVCPYCGTKLGKE